MKKITLFLQGWASAFDIFGSSQYQNHPKEHIQNAWENVGKVIYASIEKFKNSEHKSGKKR